MLLPRVFIDSNVFFYAKIMDRTFGDSCARVVRQIASGQLKASTSALVPIEVANTMRKYGLSKDAPAEVHAIFSMGIEVHPIGEPEAREAAEIFKKVDISPYDCLHAAVMKNNGLEEIVSADKDFDKLRWLRRKDPRSFQKAAALA